MLDFARILASTPRLRAALAERRDRAAARRGVLETVYRDAAASRSLRGLVDRAMENRRTHVALPEDPLEVHVTPPAPTGDRTVLASDGSTMDLDRHENADVYLVNTGLVRLEYGARPFARIESIPIVRYEDHEIMVGSGLSARAKKGSDIALERDMAELETLLSGAEGCADACLALVDGTLIRWTLEEIESDAQRRYLDQFLPTLRAFEARRIPLVSYVAAPGARDVVSLLRLFSCSAGSADIDDCRDDEKAPCRMLQHAIDAELFDVLLKDGERGPVFSSNASVLTKYDGIGIRFTYYKIRDSVVRLEFPAWVHAEGRLDGAISLLLDQLRKGDGYPVALQEAHEAAVITGSDREQFLAWIAKLREPAVRTQSAKNRSKRIKRV